MYFLKVLIAILIQQMTMVTCVVALKIPIADVPWNFVIAVLRIKLIVILMKAILTGSIFIVSYS